MSVQITFLLLPQTNLLDLGGATQVFYEAKDQGLDIDINFCSSELNITTAIGLPLGKIPSYKNTKLKEGDFLIILSADYKYFFSRQFNPDQSFLDWLNKLKNLEINICAICTGAFVLGRAGLLDGIKCTTHWKRTKELQDEFPNANVLENIIFVEDNGIYTSAGANSAIDIALHILTKLSDDFFTHKVARELVVYYRRSGSDAQQSAFLNYRNHFHGGIHKVQDYLHANLHKKNQLYELAELANMSHRNFCRIFKRETSLTVIEYVTMLRKERIKSLLNNPDLTKVEIANNVGLRSEKQVRRILNK